MTDLGTPLLQIDDLYKGFRIPESTNPLMAVNGVSFTLRAGTIVSVVGESGSGKSTLGYCLSGHLNPTSGTICIQGREVDWREELGIDARVQMAFQDAFESLDPRWSVERSLREAVEAGGTAWSETLEIMRTLGLDDDILRASPRNLPVGTQKILNLLRAAATGARLVVADEPTSGLDLEARRRMARVLRRLARSAGLTLVLISHDMPFVRHLSDQIYVMYLGGIVEEGPTEKVFNDPRHPYTMALVAAALRQRSVKLAGEIPSPTDRPSGCPLATRCPFAETKCREEGQMLIGDDDHRWACWKADSIPSPTASTAGVPQNAKEPTGRP